MPRRPSLLPRPLTIGLAFVAGLVVAWAGWIPNPLAPQPNAATARVFRPFWEAWSHVEESYVDRAAVDPERLTRGAISGMLDALGDTGHTQYLAPDEARRLREDLSGSFEGIGVRVSMRRQRPTVVWVFPQSPAQRAGILPGDVLVRVDGKDIQDRSLNQIVDLVLGPAGTDLALEVAREGAKDPVPLRITRAKLEIPDVTWHMLPGRPIAHVALQSFGEKSHEQLRVALAGVREKRARGMILDLRANPGGLEAQAVALTSEFLKGGTVYIRQDARGKQTPIAATGGGSLSDLPLVVLVDEGTASSAEICAGALQDHGRAKVVGTQTFGTGTVLEGFPLSNGGVVLLAVDQWLTPQGRQIWHKGITPDVVVTMPESGTLVVPEESGRLTALGLARSGDAQLLKALEMLEGALP